MDDITFPYGKDLYILATCRETVAGMMQEEVVALDESFTGYKIHGIVISMTTSFQIVAGH